MLTGSLAEVREARGDERSMKLSSGQGFLSWHLAVIPAEAGGLQGILSYSANSKLAWVTGDHACLNKQTPKYVNSFKNSSEAQD